MDRVEAFHREVDARARELEARHADRLRCGPGCASCCVDGITVFPVEAELIRGQHAQLLTSGTPHPEGACAFLSDDGACRVYEHRPYVCRTQGLPLRWLEAGEGDTLLEYRDICPLNEEGDPIEELGEEDCWTLGPFEARLAGIQREAHGEAATRILLRSLFRNSGR